MTGTCEPAKYHDANQQTIQDLMFMQKIVSCVTRLACDLKQTHYVANVSIMLHNAILQKLKCLVVTRKISTEPQNCQNRGHAHAQEWTTVCI